MTKTMTMKITDVPITTTMMTNFDNSNPIREATV